MDPNPKTFVELVLFSRKLKDLSFHGHFGQWTSAFWSGAPHPTGVTTGMVVALKHTPDVKSSTWTPRLEGVEKQTGLLVLRATINGYLRFYFIIYVLNK